MEALFLPTRTTSALSMQRDAFLLKPITPEYYSNSKPLAAIIYSSFPLPQPVLLIIVSAISRQESGLSWIRKY